MGLSNNTNLTYSTAKEIDDFVPKQAESKSFIIEDNYSASQDTSIQTSSIFISSATTSRFISDV